MPPFLLVPLFLSLPFFAYLTGCSPYHCRSPQGSHICKPLPQFYQLWPAGPNCVIIASNLPQNQTHTSQMLSSLFSLCLSASLCPLRFQLSCPSCKPHSLTPLSMAAAFSLSLLHFPAPYRGSSNRVLGTTMCGFQTVPYSHSQVTSG